MGTAIDSVILDAEDTAHFGHYAERIEVYYRYDKQAVNLAYKILNVLCRTDRPMTEAAIWDEVVVQMKLTDRNLLQKTLAMLLKDHYLRREDGEEDRAYQFRYDIIRRWWRKNRG